MKTVITLFILSMALLLKCQTASAQTFGSHPIDWNETKEFDDSFPNCDMSFMGAYKTLVAHVSNGQLNTSDPEIHSALFDFSRTYKALIEANATLSDAQLRQDGAQMKLGITSRKQVLELIKEGHDLIVTLKFDDNSLNRFRNFY